MTNFAGVAGARAGCGGAGHGGCRPERRGGRTAAFSRPDNSVTQRLVLKNTPATLRKRGRGWSPASQRFNLFSGIPRPAGPAACVGVCMSVWGSAPSPPSLSPSPEPSHRPGGARGDGPGGRGPLTVVPHLGVPVKVRPDAVADEERADLEATLPCHGAEGANRTRQGACPHHHPS